MIDWSKTIATMKRIRPQKWNLPRHLDSKTSLENEHAYDDETDDNATTTKPPTTTPTVRKPVRQVSDDDYIAKLSWEQLNEKIKAKHGGVGIPRRSWHNS